MMFLKNLPKFSKTTAIKSSLLIKKELYVSCFPVNFTEHLRTTASK